MPRQIDDPSVEQHLEQARHRYKLWHPDAREVADCFELDYEPIRQELARRQLAWKESG